MNLAEAQDFLPAFSAFEEKTPTADDVKAVYETSTALIAYLQDMQARSKTVMDALAVVGEAFGKDGASDAVASAVVEAAKRG